MARKRLLTVLSVALVALIAVFGTVAYLTDRDDQTNVFTIGDVAIELNEEFEQGIELVPGVRVEKEATITNTGNNDAWVWMTVAVPAVLDDENTELGTANVLHWNMPGCFWNGYHKQDKYIQSGIKDGYLPEGSTGVADEDSWINDNVAVKQTIDDVEYNVYTFKYVGAITPGETTNIGLSKVFLDENLDVTPEGQWYIVENGVATKVDWNSNTNGTPIVYVAAYAIQKDHFADVEAAYAAYDTQWGGNGGAEYGEVVSDAEGLSTALKNGNDVVMTSDIDAGSQVFVNGGVLDGAGNTLTVNSGNANYESGLTVTEGTAKNVTVTGAYRGLGVGGSGASEMTGDVTYENVTVTGATYGINIGVGNGHKLTMIDCTLGDWNSYSGLAGAEFTNCTFTSQGNYYASQRISANATFTYTDCRFEQNTYDNADNSENYYLDSYGNGTIVFVNCYMDDVLITAENVNGLFQISPKNNTTVIVNNR